MSYASESERAREVWHFPNSDIVVNSTAELVYLAPELAEIVSMEPPMDTGYRIIPLHVGGRDFAYKKKDGGASYAYNKSLGEELFEGDYPISMQQFAHLRTSILAEISLSPLVKDLIAQPDAQDIAQQHGHKSIGFVEPILGVVYRNSLRGMIYELIAAKTLLSARTSRAVGKYLMKNGIRPTDMQSRHLLVDEQSNLHLIDAELYGRVTSHR
jgi:hypothetical protein